MSAAPPLHPAERKVAVRLIHVTQYAARGQKHIWDNCSLKLAEELESLHLDAVRTIIGAVRGTSHQKLYSESGFTTLRERRFRHKIMYHKIVQENTPT